MQKLDNKQKIFLVGILIIIIIAIAYYFIQKDNSYEYLEIEKEKITEEVQKEKIIIHIVGEVNNQGIIELPVGARINDAISTAGGVTNIADLSKINLAYSLSDGQKVYIPKINDEKTEYVTENSDGISEEDVKSKKININTATQTELETLTGIGPSTALKIIEYRKENGKFKTIDELMNVGGIGEAKFDIIKENINIK